MELERLAKAKHSAAMIAEYTSALMWESRHENFIMAATYSEFAQLAAALGYRVEKIKADEVAE